MAADSLLTALKAALTSLSPTSLVAEHERLLQLRTALPALWLVPHSMHLREEVSRPFELTLDVLSTSAFVDLQALTGEQISVRLRQEDGSYRSWHAYVVGASQAGSDGGLAGYRLTCRSWLHSLGARVNTHVYQDKTALQIVESIFSEYPQASWRVDASPDTLAGMRVRAQCMQYRQTDLAMVTRLLAEEGLLFHFEHLDEAAGAQADDAGHARHVLVITDAPSTRQLLRPVRFTQPRPDLNQPVPTGTISHLLRQTQAPLTTTTVAHWDAVALHGQTGQAGVGAQPERYDGAAGIYDSAEQAQRAAEQALAASELSALRYLGTGNARHLAAGAQLVITEQPYGGGQLLAPPLALTLLSVEHWATNHLGQVAEVWKAGSPHELGAGEYRHQFEAAPAESILAPPLPERPRAPLMLPAMVVGLEQTRLTTERNLRVKVQFDFQRGERPNRAGLGYTPAVDGDAAALGNAPGNERSGTWIRMLVPVGGSDWGWVLPPRIGSDVVVCFAHGDIDQPVVVGSVYGETTPPPFAAGVDSGVNHPGTISGLHSRALDDAGGSQWVHDDAAGQLRLRIHNAQWGSELGLGHLIQQGLNSAQRGAWRGSGFEALTQGWAVARAAKGLLANTQARPGTYGSAQGSQMDAHEAVALLNGARDLGQRLSNAAGGVGAQGLTGHADEQAVPSLIKLIDLEQDGHHDAALTVPDDDRAGAGQPVPAFAEPLVVLDSASSLLAASGASTQLYASESLSMTAQGDLQQTAGHTYAQVSGQGASLYAHQGGITAHAANGPVSIRAHTDVFQILVEQGATVSSVNDEIRIFAKDKLSFGAADSGFELNGPDITFTTPGTYKEQGGTHAFLPGGNAPGVLPQLPSDRSEKLGEATGTFKSTFARDQLQRFAAEADEAFFASDMAMVFGADIPLDAYRTFYTQAKAGLPEVPHLLGYGGYAEFDAGRGCIWVDQGIACKATEGDEYAQWQLLHAMMRAWGEYLSHQLRNVWSQVGSSASGTSAGSNYALALLDLSDDTQTTYAGLECPQASGSIQVPHSLPKRRISASQAGYTQTSEQLGADGVNYRLHDGVYRPDRDGPVRTVPVFDAKMMKDDPRPGVHNHHTIEQALAADARYRAYERGMVYYGNWLRDWSQMCDGFMLPPGTVGMGLSREHMTTAVMLMGQVVAATYLTDASDWKRARPDIEFRRARLQQCMEWLGCYRPEEHIDNPAGLPDSRPHQYPKGWLVDLPAEKRLLEVDPATSMRRYIGDADLSGDYPSSLVYMQRQIRKACQLGKTAQGLIELGAGLHVLEDFFAHSNFVELALRKEGKRQVVTWVPSRSNLKDMPITTGQFTTQDMLFSLAYKMADLLLPASQTGDHMVKVRYDGLELSDWVVWAVLHDSGRTWTAKVFRGYCQTIYKVDGLAGALVPAIVREGYQQARVMAYGVLAAAMKKQAGVRIRNPQIEHYDFDSAIDPTHTMIAKDANDHPLHDLAASLARIAVLDVGRCVADVWEGKASVDQAVACASKYFVHPSHSGLLDKHVRDWAAAHPANIVKASDQAAALERARGHDHGAHDEAPRLPQQFASAWTFWSENYDELTGEADMLATVQKVAVA